MNIPALFFIPFYIGTQSSLMGGGIMLGSLLCWLGYKIRTFLYGY